MGIVYNAFRNLSRRNTVFFGGKGQLRFIGFAAVDRSEYFGYSDILLEDILWKRPYSK
jgi:hypothetical protein